jgi:hypothetical protein
MKTFNTLLALAALCATASPARSGGLVVHEWGTFTSVQGGDGKLLMWQAQQIGELPEFVYNWYRPGLNRQTPMNLMFGKGGVSGLQRMETPVIYFYSGREMNVDVDVRFPKGMITEWYPQVAQLGPCQPVAKSPADFIKNSTSESLIHWQNVRISPPESQNELERQLPFSTNGTHYFAARETDAAILHVNNMAITNAADEYERFLFYRGTGSFGTPLVVTTTDDGIIGIQNTGNKPINHLFLLHIENGRAEWAHLDTLKAGKRQSWRRLNSVPAEKRLAQDEFQKQISEAMTEALKIEKLYPAEASAMVKTWSKSWFTEDGVRVLYILPRDWTDETLPLKLNPEPRELLRVMVGRAEVITPALQKEIAEQLKLSQAGDTAANERMTGYWKRLGRFAGPAMQLASKLVKPEENKPVASAKFE